MLDAVVTDLRRGNIGYVLVKDRAGVSVWRTGRVATRNPSPLAPLPAQRGEGNYSRGRLPRVDPRTDQPWAEIKNPVGVLGTRRRSSAN